MKIVRPKEYQPHRVMSSVLRAEPKYDGHWCRIQADETGALFACGHRLSEATGEVSTFPLSDNTLTRFWGFTAPRTVLDGELYLPNEPAEAVKTAIKERQDALQFQAFAAPVVAGEDLRVSTYQSGRSVAEHHGVVLPPVLAQWDVPEGTGPTREEVLAIVPAGAEGVVLKGYWYADWWKVKPVRTVDCFVIGHRVGTAGKWLGCLKSLEVGVYRADGSVRSLGHVSGMVDAVRLSFDPINDQRKVLEVSYDKVAAQGGLRFPRFVRWRDDKQAGNCLEEQLT